MSICVDKLALNNIYLGQALQQSQALEKHGKAISIHTLTEDRRDSVGLRALTMLHKTRGKMLPSDHQDQVPTGFTTLFLRPKNLRCVNKEVSRGTRQGMMAQTRNFSH